MTNTVVAPDADTYRGALEAVDRVLNREPEADEVLGLKSGECGALVRLIEAREHVVRPEDRGER